MKLRALLIASLLAAMVVTPAGAVPRARTRDLAAAVGPVRLIPTGGNPIDIQGLHSYFGSVELVPASDGVAVVNELGLEQYLLGLQEVPLSWPPEALKAQAVAARTYALWTLGRPPSGTAAVYGFDICASIACQVFAGADVVSGVGGERWAAAVSDTTGEAVLYDGEPILARYHSTSGGQTLENTQAFPDESSYPYLQPVSSTTETSSPLYRWRVVFTLDRFEKVSERAGLWDPDQGPVRLVRTRPSTTGHHYPDVVIEGGKRRNPRSTSMTAEVLREALRDVVPAMYPDLYPSPGGTASGRLPELFPSNRFEATTRGDEVIIVGRGWGHGVGMSQWGAHGLASDGASYVDILTHYYTGTTIGSAPSPDSIEVGVATGLRLVTATGSFRVVDGRGKTLVRAALGTWRFLYSGPGTVSIDPPRGFGLPLRVGIVDAPEAAEPGEATTFTIALSRPAKVTTVTSGDDDAPVPRLEPAGRRRIHWVAPVQPGEYTVRVSARAGSTRRTSPPIEIVVSAGATPRSDDEGATASGDPKRPQVTDLLRTLALFLLLGTAVGCAVSAARMKR